MAQVPSSDLMMPPTPMVPFFADPSTLSLLQPSSLRAFPSSVGVLGIREGVGLKRARVLVGGYTIQQLQQGRDFSSWVFGCGE